MTYWPNVPSYIRKNRVDPEEEKKKDARDDAALPDNQSYYFDQQNSQGKGVVLEYWCQV